MSIFCCCSRGDEYEEYSLPNNLIYRYCVCLRFFFHQLFGGYSTAMPRLEGRSVSLPIQGTTALAATGFDSELGDNSQDDNHLSMTRQLPFTSEQRYSRLQRYGLVSRRDKLTPHFQDDSMPLRMNVSSSGAELLDSGKKWDEISSEVHSKYNLSESSEKVLDQSIVHGILYVQPSSEDEDVCPTCLDEYTLENPKIMTRCSHHFHLGCIYEWLERSESCPICGKEMEFCESP